MKNETSTTHPKPKSGTGIPPVGKRWSVEQTEQQANESHTHRDEHGKLVTTPKEDKS